MLDRMLRGMLMHLRDRKQSEDDCDMDGDSATPRSETKGTMTKEMWSYLENGEWSLSKVVAGSNRVETPRSRKNVLLRRHQERSRRNRRCGTARP